MSLAPGSTLGPYAILAELGHGGMGVVYTAQDPRLKRQVAIKLLPPDLTRDDTAKQRFLQEAQAASALDHLNICTIYEINETDDGQLYLVMAYYEGETLKQRIERGPLELDDAIDIATQVGQGLATAHRAGIAHRDIKPANLMVTTDGTVKILDFGLAKLAGSEGVTQTGTTVGTVAYMSPEQARGQEVDHRTDIWSLGVVLYEMLAGEPPFQGENLLSISNAITDSEPASLTGPSSAVQSVVRRALQKDTAGRYEAVAALVSELQQPGSAAEAPTIATTVQPDMPSIAVLPFANMSADPEQEYFCDGLSEELIDALARLEGLRVVARTSAFQFRGKGHDLREVGQKLKVKTVLEGSVRKAGNRLRVNAQLINTDDGYHLWAERYDRTLDDVFEVQDGIARSVVEKLRVELFGEPDQPLVRRQANLKAYQLYLRGRHAVSQFTRTGFANALTYFEKALVEQPDYAEALCGMALARFAQSAFGWAPPTEVMPEVRQTVLRALSIDESLADAHLRLAEVFMCFDWDWSGAEREFRRAIELNPGLVDAHSRFSQFLSMMGRSEEAIAEAKRAIEVDPLDGEASNCLAQAHFVARHFDLARDQAQKTAEAGTFLYVTYVLALAQTFLGNHGAALRACNQGLHHDEKDPVRCQKAAEDVSVTGDRRRCGKLARPAGVAPAPPGLHRPMPSPVVSGTRAARAPGGEGDLDVAAFPCMSAECPRLSTMLAGCGPTRTGGIMSENRSRFALGIATFALATLVLGQPVLGQELREEDVTREFGYITLRDGTKLSYVTYRPAGEERYPILLEFSPYGVDGTPFRAPENYAAWRSVAGEYLERGYAYAGVDLRGTSCSTGTLSMFDPLIATDGAEVIEWLGTRPWSNGAIGMIGLSYPGHTQIFVASTQPPFLKAIAAGATTASTYREVWYPGGMFNHAFIGGWAFSDRAGGAERRIAWGDTECDLEQAKVATRKTYYEVLEHPVLDEWWRERDPESYVGKIDVPTLLVQAWQDHQTQVSGPLRLFRELKTPVKKILLQPGGHGVYRRPVSSEHWLRFLDHYVKGEANGVDQEPPVRVLWEVRDVDGTPTPNWETTYPSWPPPNARPMTLYLRADGALTPAQPAASKEDGARSYTYPMGTELVADNDQFAIAPRPGGFLSYRTAPMSEDTTILGFSQLTFYMSSEQADTDVMVVLHDIDEDGNTLYLTRDFLRASFRAIDSSRSNEEETLRSFTKPEPLTPGQIYEMKLSIPPLGHVLRAGHSLELAILAPSPIGQPDWGVMIADLPGRNTVYHSPRYPSSLTLSVLPGEEARAPAPPCGVMEFQPCRKAPPSDDGTR